MLLVSIICTLGHQLLFQLFCMFKYFYALFDNRHWIVYFILIIACIYILCVEYRAIAKAHICRIMNNFLESVLSYHCGNRELNSDVKLCTEKYFISCASLLAIVSLIRWLKP